MRLTKQCVLSLLLGSILSGCGKTDNSNRHVEADDLSELTVDLGGGVKLELAPIRPGSFMMGSDQAADNEKPRHAVTIAEPFYMGKYEVTQEQWQAVMGSNPSGFKGPGRPVESVTWSECQTFLEKLGERVPTLRFRLPSEAEWEYACLGGSGGKFCYGDDEKGLDAYAWHAGVAEAKTHPVGGKKPNKWGLHDVHGNVFEWCRDTWHANYEGAPTDGAAWMEGDQTQGVLRGGSWRRNPFLCRAASRNNKPRQERSDCRGLRVATARVGGGK